MVDGGLGGYKWPCLNRYGWTDRMTETHTTENITLATSLEGGKKEISTYQCNTGYMSQQGCIPVGCVPSAAVAVCWGAVCLPWGWCLPRGAGGVCLPGRGCLPGGGGLPASGVHLPPCGQTDTCENITFLRTVIIEWFIVQFRTRYHTACLLSCFHSLYFPFDRVDKKTWSLTYPSFHHSLYSMTNVVV